MYTIDSYSGIFTKHFFMIRNYTTIYYTIYYLSHLYTIIYYIFFPKIKQITLRNYLERDLKWENVLLTERMEKVSVK